MTRTSLVPRKNAAELRVGSLHTGQDKRVYRVSWASAAKKSKVWRLHKHAKSARPAKTTKTTKPTKTTKTTKTAEPKRAKLIGGGTKVPLMARIKLCQIKKLFQTYPVSNEVKSLIYEPIANAMKKYFDYEENSSTCFKAADPHYLWYEFNCVIKDMRDHQKMAGPGAKNEYDNFFKEIEEVPLLMNKYLIPQHIQKQLGV
jgi:hypothetical protein